MQKKTYRRYKLKKNPKKLLEYYIDPRTVLALRFAADTEGKNKSQLVTDILDKHYSSQF